MTLKVKTQITVNVIIPANLHWAFAACKPLFGAFYTFISLDSHNVPGEGALLLFPISFFQTSATEPLYKTVQNSPSSEQAGMQL